MLPRRAVAAKSCTSNNKSYVNFFSSANQRNARINNSSSTQSHTPLGVLEERLHQIVVFELREDGGTEYSTMTLRALYNYTTSLITESCRVSNIERNFERQSSNVQRDIIGTNDRLSSFESPASKTTSLLDNLERSDHHKVFHKRHRNGWGGIFIHVICVGLLHHSLLRMNHNSWYEGMSCC